MKKQSNISALKELVNNNVMERVELYTSGVQAYNIAEGEEYNVIVAYAKQGGRYYFIDRDGRRFLASRYDRAEFVAGEMLEVIANDNAAAMHAADQVEASGSVFVCADLLPLFFEECDRRNIQVTSTAAGVDDLGRMLTKYDLVKDNPTQQDDDNNKDTKSNESNEGGQTPAEPSRLAQAAASVKACAANTLKRCAFVISLTVVAVVAFSVCFGSALLAFGLCDAFHLSRFVRGVLPLIVLIGPALELAANVEYNLLAAVARLFPSFFCRTLPFERFSFWGRMYRA